MISTLDRKLEFYLTLSSTLFPSSESYFLEVRSRWQPCSVLQIIIHIESLMLSYPWITDRLWLENIETSICILWINLLLETTNIWNFEMKLQNETTKWNYFTESHIWPEYYELQYIYKTFQCALKHYTQDMQCHINIAHQLIYLYTDQF